jgi:tetratricopeptide (TPR) repeat protein
MRLKRNIFWLTAITAIAFHGNTNATVLEEAGELISAGDYSVAYTILTEEISANPSSKDFGQLNYLAGECARSLGYKDEAETYFKQAQTKGVADANLAIGRMAYLKYNFSQAGSFYNKYADAKKRAKKDVSEEYTQAKRELSMANSYLERVEKLTVIDSISVPKNDFFKSYKLPKSGGKLLDLESVPKELLGYGATAPVFANEWEDMYMWAAPDSVGKSTIWTAEKLIDDTWHCFESPELSEDGDAAFPFMLSDGQTLYLAVKDESSMGGYDLAISSKDPATGLYRKPQNMGMPYNSPYDDYMLVLDEENGVGWWSTMRNDLPDMTTIYVFVKNESRENINSDTETDTLIDFARIADYKATWDDDKDYDDILTAVNSIDNSSIEATQDFYFPLRSGKVLTKWTDLKTAEGRTAMKRYLNMETQLDEMRTSLKKLRQSYANGNRSVANEIQRMEQDVESKAAEIVNVKNQIYKNETNN